MGPSWDINRLVAPFVPADAGVRFMMRPVLRLVGIVLGCYVLAVVILYFRQRAMLSFPSHALRSSRLVPWVDGEHVIGQGNAHVDYESVSLGSHDDPMP